MPAQQGPAAGSWVVFESGTRCLAAVYVGGPGARMHHVESEAKQVKAVRGACDRGVAPASLLSPLPHRVKGSGTSLLNQTFYIFLLRLL